MLLRDLWDGGRFWDPPPPPHVPGGVMIFYEGWGEGHNFEDAGGAGREVL